MENFFLVEEEWRNLAKKNEMEEWNHIRVLGPTQQYSPWMPSKSTTPMPFPPSKANSSGQTFYILSPHLFFYFSPWFFSS